MAGKIGVGIIGTGRRGYSLAECIVNEREHIDLEIRALCNRTPIRMRKAKEQLEERYRETGGTVPVINLYENYKDLIADPKIECIMINTPQYVHKGPTILALESGKKVYLDKPLAHNLEDALAIYNAQKKTGNHIIMSFTRRFEKPWIKTFDLVKEGIIGSVKMVQVRNIIPYHTYFHTWHRKMEWSGGALADKMSHIMDVFNWYIMDEPAKLNAFGGRAVFVPEPNGPERCSTCDRDCPYRVITKEDAVRPDAMVDFDNSRLEEKDIEKRHDTCVWYPGADINDHGLVGVEYNNGAKASLFWALFGPDAEDQETMELVGEKGRILLTRHSAKIDVVSDYGKKHEIIEEREDNFGTSHFGADDRFIIELDKFCKGSPAQVTAVEGLLASRMIEAAHRSIRNDGTVVFMSEVEDGEE
jgi:predicted dehydrogenase